MTEAELHRSVADFLNWMLLPPAVWTTFPAGWTAMRKGAAGRLRGCGLKAGMPDILVFHNRNTIGIELKTSDGKVSAVQKQTIKELAHAGIEVPICRSIEDVYSALVIYNIPVRNWFDGPISDKAAKARRAPQPDAGAPAA
jgi:hypothetical protein